MASRLREILLGNLGLKLASLVLALLLYAHVVTDQTREPVIQIPVTLTGLSESLAVAGDPPERVAVKIRGKWKDLIRLSLTSPYLPIDLAGAAAGRFRTVITADAIAARALPPELARALAVTEVLEPRSVDVVLEAKQERRVPLRPRLTGRPAPGFQVAGPVLLDPDSVRVEGPRSWIARTDSMRTLPIDIDGEREKIHRQVDVDPGSTGLTIEPRRSQVTVRIVKAEPDSASAARRARAQGP